MSSQEEASEEIKRLIEELTGALNQINGIQEQKQVMCEETLKKLKDLNVDADVVRRIMKRADELRGRTDRFNTSEPLYETKEYYKINKDTNKF